MQSLCTLRDHCRQGSRNTRYQAGAAPYLDRSSTGWIAPACLAHVAVGTCVSSRAPRTEPYVRLSRIRLPPWVCDGEAIARPRMKDDRFREPGLRPLRHPYPRDAILVAATPQRAPPEVDDMVPEHGQCMGVGRHGVIAEVATNDVPQPFPLIGEWLGHALPQLLFDHPQLRPHAISPGLPFDLEFALAGLLIAPFRPHRTGRETRASSGSYPPASGRTPSCHRTNRLGSRRAMLPSQCIDARSRRLNRLYFRRAQRARASLI